MIEPTSKDRHEYRRMTAYMVDPPDFDEWLKEKRRRDAYQPTKQDIDCLFGRGQ